MRSYLRQESVILQPVKLIIEDRLLGRPANLRNIAGCSCFGICGADLAEQSLSDLLFRDCGRGRIIDTPNHPVVGVWKTRSGRPQRIPPGKPLINRNFGANRDAPSGHLPRMGGLPTEAMVASVLV